MDLQRIHYLIISRASIRGNVDGVYMERHHIIPVSMGGSNRRENLVWLLPEEHYVVHHILWRLKPLNSSLRKAWTGMNNMAKNKNAFRDFRIKNQHKMKFLSSTEDFKERRLRATIAARTPEAINKRSRTLRGYKHTQVAKDNMSKAKTGVKFSEQHKLKISESSRFRMNLPEAKNKSSEQWKNNNPTKNIHPWNMPSVKNRDDWRFAGVFYNWWVEQGSEIGKNRYCTMLKETGVLCSRTTAQTCVYKFQKGWNPHSDRDWLKFLETT